MNGDKERHLMLFMIYINRIWGLILSWWYWWRRRWSKLWGKEAAGLTSWTRLTQHYPECKQPTWFLQQVWERGRAWSSPSSSTSSSSSSSSLSATANLVLATGLRDHWYLRQAGGGGCICIKILVWERGYAWPSWWWWWWRRERG